MRKQASRTKSLFCVPIIALGIALITSAQQTGDTFALDQSIFETQHDASTGLCPLFNATSCVTCLEAAIARHKGETREVTHSFNSLTAT
jgi:hypothetical protein